MKKAAALLASAVLVVAFAVWYSIAFLGDVDQFPRLLRWKEKGEFAQFQDHKVFVRHNFPERLEASSKDTLLLLHGFPTASYDFDKVWSQLERDFNVLAFDFLGFGFSDKPSSLNYTLMMQADLAEHILCQYGVKEFHILSHDYGDTVAQELLYRKRFVASQSPCGASRLEDVVMVRINAVIKVLSPTYPCFIRS